MSYAYDEICRELRSLDNELLAAGKLDRASSRRREELIRIVAAERARMEEEARGPGEREIAESGGGGGLMGIAASVVAGAVIGSALGHIIFKQDSSE